jgi:hypothetical protein
MDAVRLTMVEAGPAMAKAKSWPLLTSFNNQLNTESQQKCHRENKEVWRG